jgi:hypothetical protein
MRSQRCAILEVLRTHFQWQLELRLVDANLLGSGLQKHIKVCCSSSGMPDDSLDEIDCDDCIAALSFLEMVDGYDLIAELQSGVVQSIGCLLCQVLPASTKKLFVLLAGSTKLFKLAAARYPVPAAAQISEIQSQTV